MSDLNFADRKALNDYAWDKSSGGILVTNRNCEAYEGMVLAIIIIFDTGKAKYQLNLEWMSWGLDFYGDTLQESYSYQFENLEKLLDYLLAKYAIEITDIPKKYKGDYTQFPNPLKDESKKNQFEIAWQKFQQDFRKGIFLDPSLKLVYSSLDR